MVIYADYTGKLLVNNARLRTLPTRGDVCEAGAWHVQSVISARRDASVRRWRQTICTVCCATKRLVEINCPTDCPHLAAAREHPAAVVKRQQERDVAMLLPTVRELTERQHQLFFLFQTAIARHTPEGFARLNDDDVAERGGGAGGDV